MYLLNAHAVLMALDGVDDSLLAAAIAIAFGHMQAHQSWLAWSACSQLHNNLVHSDSNDHDLNGPLTARETDMSGLLIVTES